MARTTARIVLALVVALWIVALWALSVGAEPDGDPVAARTHCITTIDPPVGDPQEVCDPTAEHGDDDEDETPTQRTSSSSRPPSSATPSGSRSPTPSGTASSTGSPTPSGSSSPSQPPPRNIRSEITIRYRHGRFLGVVRSRSGRCEPQREVTLKEVRNGRRANAGEDFSDRNGSWKVRFPDARGRFFAKLAARHLGDVRCQGARSRTIKA